MSERGMRNLGAGMPVVVGILMGAMLITLMWKGGLTMCECWLENGVQRTAQSEYVCAACGADISITFSFLSSRDDALADQLIKKGRRQVECE